VPQVLPDIDHIRPSSEKARTTPPPSEDHSITPPSKVKLPEQVGLPLGCPFPTPQPSESTNVAAQNEFAKDRFTFAPLAFTRGMQQTFWPVASGGERERSLRRSGRRGDRRIGR
jgi:hypothetical protein